MPSGRTAEALQHADNAYEAIRAINHLTMFGQNLPAPNVYQILGNLQAVGHLLPQSLTQLALGLENSLKMYDVYQDDGSDPAVAITAANHHLTRAAELAEKLGAALDQAQNAIALQGYKSRRAGT